MLTITKLTGAEYLISSVAQGVEDYYMGTGEAPGVWRGRWAAELGFAGVVEAEQLRALVDGRHPDSGEDLLDRHRERKVKAIDATLSVPKSVSVLWAFGTPETSATVSIAVVEATNAAVDFLEEHAAVARRQEGGVRRRVATAGFAVATFAHRTSRAGDPQLHTHCLIPNLVRRGDGTHVALDANPLHVWAKATGTVFLNHLERLLTERLGVAWGPERNGSRELVGFSAAQLRAFSKRTSAIEARLEAEGELAFDSRAERMRADDRASLATRPRKDRSLTPERLRTRWADEAAAVGLEPGAGVDALVLGRQPERLPAPAEAEVFAALVDPATGLCATESRFGAAHVVERVAGLAAGRLTTAEVAAVAERFLASALVVRLAPDAARRRPPEWSTVELRAVEDRVLAHLHTLAATAADGLDPGQADAAIAAAPKALGDDQPAAVRTLCGPGPALRALVAPAGHGKTTTVAAAVAAARAAGRPVVVAAPTHKAVAELRAAGVEATTVARLRLRLPDRPLAPGTVVVVDEVSQLATRDAEVVTAAVAAVPGAQLWCVGDARQAQAVAAGGLVIEVERLGAEGTIPAATLTVNRRQEHPAERAALARLRAGDVDASTAIRTAHGWEHACQSPAETRQALAAGALADVDRHGAEAVAVLAVSHAECEDLADRVRSLRAARGELRGPTLTGPGWAGPRPYAAGDRVLLHANLDRDGGLCNGATATVLAAGADGLVLALDDGGAVRLPAAVWPGAGPTAPPTCPTPGPAPSTGPRAVPGARSTLLGTSALDAHRGYVGQSRGRLPTHTWNTRPDADHPAHLLADQRTPSEVVTDALRRDEPKTFAAADDPWAVDRRLRSERDDHQAVLATRPPDRTADLEAARTALARAHDEHHWAGHSLAHWEVERARAAPLARLRRGGRAERARADDALGGARRRAQRAATALAHARDEVAALEAAVAERATWDAAHGWRLGRVTELDDALAHHWADVVLRAVRADDPLAFGVERLRAARATHAGDLRRLAGGLPPDRREALSRAEAELHRHQEVLGHADASLARARADVEQAGHRRWGRLDKPALAAAERHLEAAEAERSGAAASFRGTEARVAEERQAVEAWAAATREATDERARLGAALGDLDGALIRTRPDRVRAAALDPALDLWTVLGSPPTSPDGLAAWCGIAERLEAWRDRHPLPEGPSHPFLARWSHPVLGMQPDGIDAREWSALGRLLDRAPAIIAAASRPMVRPPARSTTPSDGRWCWRRPIMWWVSRAQLM